MIINFAPTTYARVKVWTEYPINDNLEYYETVPKNGRSPIRHNEHETIFKSNQLIDFFDGFLHSPKVVEYAQFKQGYYPKRAYTLDRRNYKWVRYGFEFEYYDGQSLKLNTNYSAINAYKKAGY